MELSVVRERFSSCVLRFRGLAPFLFLYSSALIPLSLCRALSELNRYPNHIKLFFCIAVQGIIQILGGRRSGHECAGFALSSLVHWSLNHASDDGTVPMCPLAPSCTDQDGNLQLLGESTACLDNRMHRGRCWLL